MNAKQAAKLVESLQKIGLSRKQIVKLLSQGFRYGSPISKKD